MTTFRSFDEQGNMIRCGRTGCGKQGVVSAGRAEAAEIGRDILAQGGNAIDAGRRQPKAHRLVVLQPGIHLSQRSPDEGIVGVNQVGQGLGLFF